MYILTYLYILAEISAYHLQLKCMGGHLFPGHPYIESTTVLSDTKLKELGYEPCGTVKVNRKGMQKEWMKDKKLTKEKLETRTLGITGLLFNGWTNA